MSNLSLYETKLLLLGLVTLMKQPTMKDVAKMAGVSQPTVSHVINGTATISENVIKKVNEVIDELGYVPNAMAKSLKTSKSNIIGLIVPDVSIRFYSEMVRAIETGLRLKGYMVFLCNTFYDKDLEMKYIRTLIEHNVLGVISGSDLLDAESYSVLKNKSIPVVLLDTAINSDRLFNVKVDNYMLAKMAVSHLYDVGARRISYASEPLCVSVLKLRYEYFKKVVAEFGLTFDEKANFIAQNQYENFSKMKTGYNLAANILLNNSIDAVFASSDELAFGIVERLSEHKIKIPEQIQIMGCDNDPFSSLMNPSLTTIWQPIIQMADISVSMILRLIKKEVFEQSSIKLEPNIIIRESTMKFNKAGNYGV
jgi:DNA-binding LacI/PurR family transcriptional regulator